MNAILPDADQDDFPTGFSIVGHVGASINSIHFNRNRMTN